MLATLHDEPFSDPGWVFERKLDGNRAEELDYMLGQIEASEVRTGARIGQTNQALRYVALASNPNVSER